MILNVKLLSFTASYSNILFLQIELIYLLIFFFFETNTDAPVAL